MKKFSQFIAEANDTSIMPHDILDFKYVVKYMDERDAGRYLKAIDSFWAGYQAKQIYKARFGEAYSYDLSRSLEHAFSKVSDQYDQVRRDIRDQTGVWDSFDIFSINSIAKMLRTYEKEPFKSRYAEVYHFLYSLRNLPKFIKELKTFFVAGREPKPVDPNVWQKPMVPLEAKKKAVTFLNDAIDSIRQEYYNSMEKSLLKVTELLINKVTSWGNFSEKFYSRQNANLVSAEDKIIAQKIYTFESGRPSEIKMNLKANYKEIIRKEAIYQVDTIIFDFLAKNSEKLGHIFAKKAVITEHKIITNRVVNRNLENHMRFKFDDNSGFDIYTSTVYGYSKLGNLFVKFPTRFTDVIMKDGSKMGMPSEEKMIKEF